MNINIRDNVLIISNDDKTIQSLKKFFIKKYFNTYVSNINSLDKIDLEKTIIKNNQRLKLVVVSSDIYNYKLNKIPRLLMTIRSHIEDIRIILIHPSKVHSEDRKLIVDSAGRPFNALQEHDFNSDPESHLEMFFDALID